jgi:hypothetical protein
VARRWVRKQEHPAAGEHLLHHLASIAISFHFRVKIGLETLFIGNVAKLQYFLVTTFSKFRAKL